MKTVAQVIKELSMFPGYCECFAYEGEVTGIIIEDGSGKQGVVFCDERGDGDNIDPILIGDKNPRAEKYRF